MSTTPTEPGGTMGGGGSMGPGMGMRGMSGAWSGARMPIPGNAEFAYLIVAFLLLMIIAWISDSLNVNDWWTSFTWLSIAYILSRGIAKASRVLEQ
jgi:hypothetical protein